MYDREASDYDDVGVTHDKIATIIKWMQGSLSEDIKGRMVQLRDGNRVWDRVSLTLDRPYGDSEVTPAMLITEPSDPFTVFDGWEELGDRLRRLWPHLSDGERRNVLLLVADPESTGEERAALQGVTKQAVYTSLETTRRKARRLLI